MAELTNVQAVRTPIRPESTVSATVPLGTVLVPPDSVSLTDPVHVVVDPKLTELEVQLRETDTLRLLVAPARAAEACWGNTKKPAAAIATASKPAPKRRAREAERSALAVNLFN